MADLWARARAAVGLALPALRDHHPQLLAFLPPPPAGLATPALQLTAFRMAALAWALAALCGKGREPVERWLASVRSAVRDEKYLMRLELVDYAA